MHLVDIDTLEEHEFYTVTGGDGWTIPHGLYKCDGYGATEGIPVKLFNLEEYDSENRNKLIQTILENQFTIRVGIDAIGESVEYQVVDVRDIDDVSKLYNYINGEEFNKFLHGDD